ncbi:MAG: zinc-ribbon domain containing protein [Betaproteobacteria bacterium]
MTKQKIALPKSIPADPNQWSDQSKQTVSFIFNFIREYTDKPFNCWRCSAACVFTAEDQKYTVEVKKASIDQRRKFCAECWSESHQLKASLATFEDRWADQKRVLQTDREFLAGWLELLDRWKEFAPYKQDVARINMLRKVLGLNP